MKSNLSYLLILLGVLALTAFGFTSQKPSEKPEQELVAYEYMQINVLESVVSGGAGRSRMIVTDAMGRTVESVDINNYYSMIGINFKNIQENETTIVGYLNILGNDGWELTSLSSGGNDVYFTKYVLRRTK